MKVKLLAFGIAKEIVGGSSNELDIPVSATILDVKDALTDQFPEFSKLRQFSVAVNEAYQEDDYVVNEGDELVIIPPVSGG